MPRLSGDTLLQRAITAAVQDRMSLADCYSEQSEQRSKILEEVATFQALRGRKLAEMNASERSTTFSVLVCAQQWEDSLADANHRKGKVAQAATRAARLYREFRLTTFGPSKLEAAMAEAKGVDIRSLHPAR